jgi:hypothetical protein
MIDPGFEGFDLIWTLLIRYFQQGSCLTGPANCIKHPDF